jgi:uncharacterized damage-inducible protein DinB
MDFQKQLVNEFDLETARTRKMLAAIPADADFTWKPHPKSMSLGRLAGHTAELAGEWGISTLTKDKLEFSPEHKFEAYIPVSTKALLERFDKEVATVKAELAKFTSAMWDGNWKFIAGGQAWIDESKYEVWRSWVINHMIHHRAQLGVYLRLLGKPIPGTYGPSADESK